MKKLLIFLMCFLGLNSYIFASNNQDMLSFAYAKSCPQAKPDNDPGFCSSYAEVAKCQCMSRGLPASVCQDVNKIYERMIATFGSVDRACEYQHDTDKQTCIDYWSCYRKGGTDSHGNLCSSTGRSC